jgi:deazaflavin-dependent oxidoreductase (nitroreductase family)
MRSRCALRHVNPRSTHGFLYRTWATLVASRLGLWFSRHIGWKVDPCLLRLSGGRLGTGLVVPTALLETRGARSGQTRRNGVIYFHDGEHVTLIASKAGAPEHPSWFYNARANPEVRLNGQPYRAELIEDDSERARSGSWPIASFHLSPATERAQLEAAARSRFSSSPPQEKATRSQRLGPASHVCDLPQPRWPSQKSRPGPP